jgi:hypothetical protein
MSDFHIEREWLEVVRNKALFYPAAGGDYCEALNIFCDHIDTFWFSDINYSTDQKLPSVFSPDSGFRRVEVQTSEAIEPMEERRPDRPYRFLKPGKLIETYERTDGRRLIVIRRRGFGQIALSTEFSAGSLGVFMHCGDSRGEGGSKVYFLSNMKTNYEPCGNLFDKIGRCLADRALIISDGSNTSIRRLRRFHWKDTQGREAFCHYRDRPFTFWGFHWTCVGWLSRRYGPTLVWGVTREVANP